MARPTVLVVDDDQLIADMIRVALEQVGYQVAVAFYTDVLPTARQVQPHVVLLDIMMTGIDGGELSRQLRADPETAAIPIVAMTGAANLSKYGDLPVDDWIPKPFHLDDLFATVARWAAPA